MRPDFDNMNETDVREIVVRPLLTSLGYAHGTPANIRTEFRLTYNHHFLGRKKPSTDPPLAGRADYICDAVSYGRWVVEAKPPSQPLTRADVEQAHTYAAHPEIAASHFLLTNGREFQLYVTSSLDAPALAWSFDEIDDRLMLLKNILGYDAIKARAKRAKPDPNKPLGPHLPSRLAVVGGEVRYGEHVSDHPLLQVSFAEGMTFAIGGGSVSRGDDGRLTARVRIIFPSQPLIEINRLAGINGEYDFFSSDEYFSTDVERPTILQNLNQGSLPAGTKARFWPGMPELPILFGFDCSVTTEAVGFVSDSRTFEGVLSFDYIYLFKEFCSTGSPQIDAQLFSAPRTGKLSGRGQFRLIFGEP